MAASKPRKAGRGHRDTSLGSEVLEVKRTSVTYARSNLPRLLRLASSGVAVEICSGKGEHAPTAILISQDAIRRYFSREGQRRTLRDLVDSLPFKRGGNPRLRAELPDDDARRLRR